MLKFLKSLTCLTLVSLLLSQPCFALVPINPVTPPVLPHTNFTVTAELINKSPYSQPLPLFSVQTLSKIGEGSNSQTSRQNRRDYNLPQLRFRKLSAHLTYDLLSQLTKITPDNNTLATFAYDFLGRRYQKDLANTIAKRTTYQYDLVNRLTQIKNTIISSQPPGGIKYPVEQGLLDNDQELLAYPVIRESGTRESGYPDIRDKIVPDNLITQSPSPGSPDNPMSLSNKYPIESGALNDNSFGGGDGLCVLSRVMGFGLWGNNSQLTLTTRPTTHNTPSELGSLINPFSTLDAQAQGPKINTQYTYTYDNAGNRLSRQIQSTSIGNSQEGYVYDDIYQLTGVTGAQTHSFDYDEVGNRQIVDGVNYVSNNLNQYTQVGANNFTNDANGNLTTDGTNTYTYDYENRLITAIGGQNSSYAYDGFGRRISKTVNGTATYFVYDGDQIIEERDSAGTLQASYVYGTGIDEVLTMNRNSQTYYYFYDGLGSVTEITNAAGELEESYQYDVYGQPSQLSTIGNRFMFTGREYDAESGLYHYRARAYSPTIGRFLQRDPVTWGPDDIRSLSYSSADYEVAIAIAKGFGLDDATADESLKLIYNIPSSINQFGSNSPSSLHPYLYCDNNSINWVDPSGFDKTGNKGNFPKGYYYPEGNNKYTPYYNPIPFRGSPYYGNFRTPFTSAALGAYAFKPILTNVYSVILSQAIFGGPKGYFWAKFGIELFTGGPASVPKTFGVFKVNPPPAE